MLMSAGGAWGFVYRLASSLDNAINLALGQGSSFIQYVVVSCRPMVRRAAELLVGGAVMAALEPHGPPVHGIQHAGHELLPPVPHHFLLGELRNEYDDLLA